jgi:hypothetical protein
MLRSALFQALLDSWNRRHAAEMASLFVADGVSIGFDGSQMRCRTEIEASQPPHSVAAVRGFYGLGSCCLHLPSRFDINSCVIYRWPLSVVLPPSGPRGAYVV